ncbi:uncharacterized protein RBU57_001445 [Macrochelys suwanniensis]
MPRHALLHIPENPVLQSTFGAIFQRLVYCVPCLFRGAGMDPELLTSTLLALTNMSRVAVELFLKLQRQEECNIDLTTCSSYNTRLLVAFMEVLTTVECHFWARETSTEWWDHIVLHIWDDEQWLQNFRMRKATFVGLCDELTPALRRKDMRMRAAPSLEKRVAIALWKLATPDCYRSVANQFGVGKSTVGVMLMEVCRAINHILLRKSMILGNMCDVVDVFAQMGFPNCGWAIDGTHIPILAPDHLATEYINRKGYFSMVLQALVDHVGVSQTLAQAGPEKCMMHASFKTLAFSRSFMQGLSSQTRRSP